jgi:PAS domain S-box-containing protein
MSDDFTPDRVGAGAPVASGPAEQALRSALPCLAGLLGASSTILHLLRQDGRAFRGVWVGGSVTRILGYTPEEACRPSWWIDNLHPEDRAVALANQATLLRDGHLIHEYRFRHKNGTYRWVRDDLRLLRNDGGPCEAVGSWVDITDRKRTEEALREREERYALATAAGRVAVWDYDVRRDKFYADAIMMEFWGVQLGELATDRWAWLALLHPEDREPTMQAFQDHLEGRTAEYGCEFRVLGPNGVRWGQTRGTAVRDADDRPLRVIGTTTDITDRKRAEEELRAASQRLRALSRRLLEVQEQERRHLARELHDEIGQYLTGLKLQLEAAGLTAPTDVAARLAGARAMLRDLTERVRELSLRLRPTMLDDLGLVPALVWLLERYTAQTGVRVAFTHAGLGRRFPPEAETAAYRIVQEALTNVARHAGVAEAEVRLTADGGGLTVAVADRGAGFDPAAAAARPTGGLSGMRERAELLGGTWAVEAAPGAGTRVTARLPVFGGEREGGGGPFGATGG